MAKILVVEDDEDVADTIKFWLEKEGHILDVVYSGEDALQLLKGFNFDVIVLDYELPNISGFSVMQNFRNSGGNTPVIFLTGKRDVNTKADTLDGGADDYLTKPFDPRELTARIRVMLRRPAGLLPSKFAIGNVEIEIENQRVYVNGELARLTTKEYAVLEFLMRHPNKGYSAKALLEAVWASHSESSEDAVRSCMKTLRRKITSEGTECIIKSVPGGGYIIEP
jgi:DNA-binding response OmpR family regulator